MFNNPIDVIKTNMQSLDAAHGGFTGAFSHILRTEGPMGFYKGVGPRLARVILDVALTFTIYNQIKRLFMKFTWLWWAALTWSDSIPILKQQQ